MKKNLYYQSMFGRTNKIKQGFLSFFLTLSFFFRIPIEVIIRKNFGERYFSLFLSIVIGLVFLVSPYIVGNGHISTSMLFTNFLTWYAFTAYYCYCVYKRWQEVRREPSVFDFAKFSLSTGKIHPFFLNIRKQSAPNYRLIETLYEPGAFFIAGAILTVCIQPLGIILMGCAVVYSLGYMAAYSIGDTFVMDKIDEMICNQTMIESFVNDSDSNKGMQFYGKKPNGKELREDFLEQIIIDDEEEDVVLAL